MLDETARFLAFSFAAADVLAEVDRHGKITFVAGAVRGILGQSDKNLIGQPLGELFTKSDSGMLALQLADLGMGKRIGPTLLHLEHPPINASAEAAMVQMHACRLPHRPDHVACTIGRVPAMMAAAHMKRRRDNSTGMLSVDDFADVAGGHVASARQGDNPLTLTTVDLPGLEQLTADLPESMVKTLMDKIGTTLRAASMDGDSAGRLGPGRFGVVHEAGKAPEAITNSLNAIARDMNAPGLKAAVQSMSLASTGLQPEDAIRAVRYSINRLANEDEGPMMGGLAESFDKMVQDTLSRIAEFSDRINKDEFRLVYQPIVNLADRSLHHFEALVRFNGDGSPFETIQFAEETGIIGTMDLAVIDRVIVILKGLSGSSTSIAANLSGRSLASDLFVRCLMDRLKAAAPLGKRLLVEVTESAAIKDLTRANNILQDIRKLGFTVCLDDIGAGAAGFDYVHALQADAGKIDGRYIKKLVENKRDSAMVIAMANLFRRLDMFTIAEMVETEEQAAMLQSMKIECGQGWLFGKPLESPSYEAPKLKVVAEAAAHVKTITKAAPIMKQIYGERR
ncbi:EAL domain-containing protein [Lacibacterium aquatile]|uniref:EAL domain-containing protein n=1 Tax=Lacibacterium aquatile TaxID=1168082 RepID=A0ABW5DVT4_9PROT